MSRTLLSDRRLVGSFALLLIVLMQAGCTSLLGDFESGGAGDASSGPNPDATTSDGAKGNDSGLGFGTLCTAATQCASGFCADGVCCNSACSGTCESCNQAGALSGTCSPIAANTDPQMECVMTAPPVMDAGAVDSGSDASDAAAADGGDAAPIEGVADARAGDAGVADGSTDASGGEAGPSLGYNQPEGGVTTDGTKCAGSCDGKGGNGGGSCIYPDSTRDCGTQFCNTSAQKAGFVCDGAGHCGLSLTNCTDYSCSNTTNTCGTMCSAQADCLPTDYCDGLNCHPKRGSGIPCTTPGECTSGFCDDTVCCDTDCSGTPNGNCNKTAPQAGQCTCNSCATGPCALFYRDADGDGQGDPAVTLAACASGAPPTGYVLDNRDCDDADANVYYGQTAYFSTPSLGKHTYDYNCDGSLEKGIPEYPSYYSDSYCGFCGSPQTTSPACSVSTTTCSTTGAQSTLGCSEYFRFRILEPVVTQAVTTQASPQLVIGGSNYYCGPSETLDPTWDRNDRGSGFAGTVGCGQSGSWIYCGTCSGTTGAPDEYNSSNTQTCH